MVCGFPLKTRQIFLALVARLRSFSKTEKNGMQRTNQLAGFARDIFDDTSCRPLRLSVVCAVVLVGLLVVSACSRAPQTYVLSDAGGEWHDFKGTWIAAGSRDTVRLGGDRRASITSYSGSLVLAGPSRPGVGFRAEAIALNDSDTGTIGRAVWTDERGDHVYSKLRGEGTATSNKILGTFIGGTGRYAGATGTYEFAWRFMIENEEGNVQGQSTGLHGRIRVASPLATPDAGGQQP